MRIRPDDFTRFTTQQFMRAAVFAATIVVVGPQLAIASTQDPINAADNTNSGPPADAVETLRRHGEFFTHPKWGGIWRPQQATSWRPYTLGRWAKRADATMEWVSDEPFGDTVYHYGRWSFDPDQQWIWIPGSNRAPSWVAWRQNDQYVGWAALPPTPQDAEGRDIPRTDIYDAPEFSSYWVYAPADKWMTLNLKDYLVPQANGVKLARQTKPVKAPAAFAKPPPSIAKYDDEAEEPTQSISNEPVIIGDADPVDQKYAQIEQDRERFREGYREVADYGSIKDGAVLEPRREAYADDFYPDDDFYEDDYYDDEYDYDDSIVYEDIYPQFEIYLAGAHPYYTYYYFPFDGAPPRYFGLRRPRPFIHRRFKQPRFQARSREFQRNRRHSRFHDARPRRSGPRINAQPRFRGGVRSRGRETRANNRPNVRNGGRARNRVRGGARNRGAVRTRSGERRADRNRGGARNRGANVRPGRRQVSVRGPSRNGRNRTKN